MAAERHFVYTGGERWHIPDGVTHVSIHDSITLIFEDLFEFHRNIVELICHERVERIEERAFYDCPYLKRVVIPGVKILIGGAFHSCVALTHVECPQLERIGGCAFYSCKSLSSINLQSVKVVGVGAFARSALTDVEFGSNLESVGDGAFEYCSSLEQVTLPLKEDIRTSDNAFHGCDKLSRVDLIERAVIYETISALLMDKWRDDMRDEIDSINQRISNANPGGGKARVIQEWMRRVLQKIVDYKAQHRQVLNEATTLLQLSLPNDIVTNNIMSFLELPSHTFEGEIGGEGTDGMPEQEHVDRIV